MNGEVVPEGEAAVSVRDRGFRYGDAAFETLRVYDGTIFEWPAHVRRLEGTCRVLELDHGLSAGDLRRRIDVLLERNGFDDASVRLSITRGVQPGKLTPRPEVEPGVVVLAEELPPGGPGSPPLWDGPASAVVAGTRRIPDEAIPARAKTHNYLNGILARLEARRAGTEEAILLDADGAIAEGATSNCFHVVDGTLMTPSTAGPVLPGITRKVVMELAGEAGIPVETGRYDVDALLDADEAFLTNTTWEVRPLGHVDGHPVGGGPVTERLAAAFDAYVARTCHDDGA